MARKTHSPETQAAIDAAVAAEKKVAAKLHKSLLKTHQTTVKAAIAEKTAAAKADGDKASVAHLKDLSGILSSLLAENHSTVYPAAE